MLGSLGSSTVGNLLSGKEVTQASDGAIRTGHGMIFKQRKDF